MGSVMKNNLHIDRGSTEFLVNYLIATLSSFVQSSDSNIKSGDIIRFPKNIEWVYKKPTTVSTGQLSIFEED
jgi:hypothetical protein